MVCLLSVLLLPACGYTTRSTFPEQYATVAVPIFENRTFLRGLERDVTEALIKEIENSTPYKVVPRDRAQTVLEGTITGVDQDRMIRSRTGGVPLQQELTITVSFTWSDERTGDVLRGRRGFESVGQYLPPRPVGEFLQAGQHEAAQRMAQDIVAVMRDEP